MFEEKSQTSNQEAVVVDVTKTRKDELLWEFCKSVGLSADEIAQIMNAADEPAEATRARLKIIPNR